MGLPNRHVSPYETAVTAIDFTVINPLQAARVGRAAQDGGSAVEHAHMSKMVKYGERCAVKGLVFVPLAVDTFGGWHPSALAILTRLGRQVASNAGREGQEVVRHLRQRLAVLLVRDNVAMLCARTPSFVPPEVDGAIE